MKKLAARLSVIIILISLAFMPQFNSLGMGEAFQQPEPAWIVWEPSTPIQRVAWDSNALWAGAYQGGLSQWQLEAILNTLAGKKGWSIDEFDQIVLGQYDVTNRVPDRMKELRILISKGYDVVVDNSELYVFIP